MSKYFLDGCLSKAQEVIMVASALNIDHGILYCVSNVLSPAQIIAQTCSLSDVM